MRKTLFVGLIALLLALPPVSAFAQGAGPIVRSAVMQNAAVATGNGATLDTGSASTATIQMTGGSGVVTLEASNDGTNWTAFGCYPIGSSTVDADGAYTVTSTPQLIRCNVSGIAVIRARVSTFTSGTITAVGVATSLPFGAANAF